MEVMGVKTPSLEGKIYLGEDAVASRLPALIQGKQCFVVTDSNVYALYKEWFQRWFHDAEIFVLPAGEERKNFASLELVLEKMVGAGLKRTSKLIVVGGGVIGDLGGLCASLYMRGIEYVQVPTTLLAMVDSSVGGKTAIDFQGVKNIVGSFYSPCEVWIDPMFLGTLPSREWKCGIGEVVKYAALSPSVFQALSAAKGEVTKELAGSLIEECIRFKADVCQKDEHDRGERKCLNIGHTTGHAIELAYGLSHGESILLGMALETELALSLGICEDGFGKELLAIVGEKRYY